LEEWAALSKCSLVAFKLPPGYKLKSVLGYTKEEIPFKNSLLIILKKSEDKLEEYEKRKREKQEKDRIEYETWRNNLKNFLRYNILPKILSSDAALDKLVSDDAMKIWEVAFTNESFNPNQGYNYEELELLGDTKMNANYVKFLMASYPSITRSQLSEFLNSNGKSGEAFVAVPNNKGAIITVSKN